MATKETVSYEYYHCDKCGSRYERLEDALECERRHFSKIVACRVKPDFDYFVRNDGRRDCYPCSILVTFNNGQEIEYIPRHDDYRIGVNRKFVKDE